MGSLHATKDLVPEGFLLLGALVCAGLGAARRATSVRTFTVVGGTFLLAATLSSLVFLRGLPGPGFDAYSGAVVVDRITIFAIPVLCAFTLLSMLGGEALAERIRPHAGEYHALLLTATLGAVLMCAARDMVALYVALELLGISLSILVAMAKTERSGSEAAFKHLVMGAASSAMVLYGFAMLYGLAGSTNLADVATALRGTTAATAFGIAVALAGMAFRLGAVPFHQWVADVHEGAPAPVAGLAASLGTTAGFVMVARFALTALPHSSSTWTAAVAALAVASMVAGTLTALAQRRMRRLLAFTAVGQAGFVLMGLLGSSHDGVGAALFYLLAYGITMVGAFAAVLAVEGGGAAGDDLESYAGLSVRAPFAAATLGIAMVSLLGAPPLLGFFAKLFVLQAAVLEGWGWLLVVALAATVVSAASCLRVVKVIFIDPPAADAEEPEPEPPALRGTLVVTAAAMAFLGVAAQPLLHVASAAAGNLP